MKIEIIGLMFFFCSCKDIGSNLKSFSVTKDGYISEGFSINDTIDGPFIQYYQDRQVYRITQFKNSMRFGPGIEYYENGRVKNISHFLNDKYIGHSISFYPDGKMAAYSFCGYQSRTFYRDTFDQNGIELRDRRLENIIDRLSVLSTDVPKIGEEFISGVMVAKPPYTRLSLKVGEEDGEGAISEFEPVAAELEKEGEYCFKKIFDTSGNKKIIAIAELLYSNGRIVRDTMKFDIVVSE